MRHDLARQPVRGVATIIDTTVPVVIAASTPDPPSTSCTTSRAVNTRPAAHTPSGTTSQDTISTQVLPAPFTTTIPAPG